MANYGHAKIDLGHKKMRKVNTLSNYALEEIAKGKRTFGNNGHVSKKAVTEAQYILRRRQDKKFRDKIKIDE